MDPIIDYSKNGLPEARRAVPLGVGTKIDSTIAAMASMPKEPRIPYFDPGKHCGGWVGGGRPLRLRIACSHLYTLIFRYFSPI